ncbi:MAG: hypothetical protein MUE96_11020 [Bacteroidia bacterium]|nr:hypothetical protein [Bacteroidia bacterium]
MSAIQDALLILSDYLKGKSIYPPVRRMLNLLFAVSISSFFYESAYGNYAWLDYNDYKSLLDFIIKGKFFIPFSIFIVVNLLIQGISNLVFIPISHFVTVKWTRTIVNYELQKESIDDGVNRVIEVSGIVTPMQLNEQMLIEVGKELKEKITNETYDKIEKDLSKPKRDLEASFHFAFKGIIAITIYFISLPDFGWILYSLTLILAVIAMFLTVIAHCFLGILPALVRRFYKEVTEYISKHQTV